jgi:hypothetical protein
VHPRVTFHAHPNERFPGPERAALAGHASRAEIRTLGLLPRPPRPVFERVTGTGW